MFSKMVDIFFGCRHKHYSFPISKRPGQRRYGAALQTGTYVVCLDCGKEFAYDWQQMHVIDPSQSPAAGVITDRMESYAAK
jgi:hypothetical protein